MSARTASQRAAASRRKGAVAERDLVRWLRANGFPGAERAVRTGYRTPDRTAADPGDVTGTPGIVWSVKDCAVERIATWLAELDAMDTSTTVVRLLVAKRRGHADPGEWWCWLRAHDFAALLDDAETAFAFPVQAALGDVVMLLRAAGYGDPITEAVAS